MSFLAVCTFDISNAKNKDYDNLYAALEKVGLSRELTRNDSTKSTIPTTTTVAGFFNGDSSSLIYDYVYDKIKKAYDQLKLKGEFFLVVGGDWVWNIAKV